MLDDNPWLRNNVIVIERCKNGKREPGGKGARRKFYFYLCRKIVDARQQGREGGEGRGYEIISNALNKRDVTSEWMEKEGREKGHVNLQSLTK